MKINGRLMGILYWILIIVLFHHSGLAEGKYTEVQLTAEDGIIIRGNYWNSGSKDALLLLNGLLMNKDLRIRYNLSEALSGKYDVLNIDFRGHGRSAGVFTGGEKEILDIRAAMLFLKDRGYKNIGILGLSFGGYMAIRGAEEFPEIKSVASISAPFYVDRKNLKTSRQKFLVWLLSKAGKGLAFFLNVRISENLPLEMQSLKYYLEKIKQPVFVIHGAEDTIVPLSDAEDIYSNTKGRKNIYRVPGAGHAEAISKKHFRLIEKELFQWFDATLK